MFLFLNIFCIFLTNLKYVFETFGPPWGVTYLQNIRKPGPKAPEGESPSMDMSQNDVNSGSQNLLVGGNSNIFLCSTRIPGETIFNLTSIFFKWVGSTTN